MRTGHAARVVGLAAAFAGLVLGLAVASAPPRAAVAAPTALPVAQDEKKEYAKAPDSHKLIGAAICQNCHDEENPAGRPIFKQTLGHEFVRLWENRVWASHDLHSTAYTNILTKDSDEVKKGAAKANATAQKMEDKLRRYTKAPKYADPNYRVSADVACLACHASTNKPVSQESPDKWTAAKSFQTVDGVGCEMCHGHGSGYEQKHQASVLDKDKAPEGAVRYVEWRDFPPAEKQAWGLVNLRDPATATAKCASCHVGNTAEGRFVTHDMYAAGHPPLPPLDLLAYSREQPRHWGLASDMPYIQKLAKKDAKKAHELFHYRADESLVARRFAESTVAVIGSVGLLGAQLADDAEKRKDGLDFAAFDCYSCHHTLKYPSERQERGYVGRPGRPTYRPAAFVLARVVLDHAAAMPDGAALKDARKALDAAERELADAFTDKTYGDPKAIRAATAKLAEWAADARGKLQAVRYTPDETKKLHAKVVAATQGPLGDPEAAQLLAWAFETLEIELNAPADKKEPPAAVKAVREGIKDVVVSRLRPKTPFYTEQGREEPMKDALESVSERIGPRMELFNAYRGEPFRKAFAGVKPK